MRYTEYGHDSCSDTNNLQKGVENMTTKQIYEELKRRDNEWIRSFIELLRQYEEATPEHKEMVLEMLRRSKG